MQGLLETFSAVIEGLERGQIPYMVVGSVAAMVYGEPRMTHDLDLVISIAPNRANLLPALFPETEYYCPPSEVIRAEVVHRGQFNLIHHDTGFKIDLIVRKDTEHARTEFARRRKAPFWNEREVFVASPEDVILMKLDYFRQGGSQKHLGDIRGILAETSIDTSYLDHWIAQLGLERQWEQVKA
jgi:hypothetical protein